MKIKQKIFLAGMALLMVCGSFSAVNAATAAYGGYRTVTHKNIPRLGGINYQTTYGVKKTDTDIYATFYLIKKDALLGNCAALIGSNKSQKTSYVGLVKNTAILARESSVTKGGTYYSAVSSTAYEPSNTCDVTMKFSADNMKPTPK